MATYLYLKEDQLKEIKRSSRHKRKIIASGLLIAGLILLLSASLPIIKFEIYTERRFLKASGQDEIISPLVLEEDRSPQMEEELDLSLLSNWFPDNTEIPQSLGNSVSTEITDYNVSIPTLEIFNAHVKIGGTDLDDSLIHYGGSALPGELGTSVIFGHSVLPQFFNPQNYTTIFSTLPTLEKGDEIFVHYDGILYKYLVESLITAKPDDLSILRQDMNDSFVTLITCVPPGTYWKRLAVKARLTKI